MQRAYFFLFLVLFAQCKSSSDKQAQTTDNATVSKPRRTYDYCYTNSSGIFVFNAGDRIGRQIKLDATDVHLSPDGTMLAYTYSDSANPERRIGMMDLETGRAVILDTACQNCYGPVWSPDGKYLAYNAFTGSEWGIKYVDTGGRHADFLARPDTHGYYSPSWTADSKRVLVQNMSAVYFIDLKGTIVKTIPFQDIDTNITASSSMSFLLTPKEDKLIYSTGLKWDSVPAPNSDETPNYIFSYDMNSKKVIRLTQGKYNCFYPVLRGDTIFCHGWNPTGREHELTNLYRMDVNGGNFKLAFKSCSYFSCRQP